jgi:Protein of unknown function (DUF1493)
MVLMIYKKKKLIKKMKISKQELLDYFSERVGLSINDSSVLFTDLEVIGDDITFLLMELEEKFDVDFKTFVFEIYAVEEMLPFQYLFYQYFFPKKLKRKEFTIEHLIRVIEQGKWFDPE